MRFSFGTPSDWDLNAAASIVADVSAPVQPNALHLSVGGVTSSASRPLTGLVVGQQYPVFVRCNFDHVDGLLPHVQIRYADQPAYFNANLYKDEAVSGWELRDCGLLTYGEPGVIDGLLRLSGIGEAGQYAVINEIIIGADEPSGFEMSKQRELRASVVAKVGSVLTGNGYALSIAETVDVLSRIPDAVEAFPHVAVIYGEVNKELGTLTAMGRKRCVCTFQLDVYCRQSETTNSAEQCEDACGEIESALEEHDGSRWVGFPLYVQNVFVHHIQPSELPNEVSRDIRRWSMLVDITYNHERRNP